MSDKATSRHLCTNSKAFDYSNEQYVEDVTIAFLYTPYTISMLLLSSSFLCYLAFFDNGAALTGLSRGLLSCCLTIIALGMLVFPSGPFIRPHPAIWRLVFGISVCYLLALILLLNLDRDDAREALRIFDPNLNKAPVWRPYADNCDLTWDNVYSAIFDRFVIAHFLGWVCKSLLIRSRSVCWIASATWEIIEISTVHMMPNFAECYWDSWILDFLICNGLGIEVGHRLCEFLEVHSYEWVGVFETPTIKGKAKRMLLQLTPASWMRVHWHLSSNWRRFLGLQALMVLMQLKDLNAFFLKHILWIPSEHNLNGYRLLLLFIIALPTMRQIYIYSSDPRCKRLGSQAWVMVLITFVETMINIKFGRGMFPQPIPRHVIILWAILGPVIILIGVVFVVHAVDNKKRSRSDSCSDNEDIIPHVTTPSIRKSSRISSSCTTNGHINTRRTKLD